MELNERERKQLSKTGFPGWKKVQPHPDGKPWDKCCRGATDGVIEDCQCFMRRNQKTNRSRHDRFVSGDLNFSDGDELRAVMANNDRFLCLHRTDDGYYRECAGWYAKYGRKRHEKA